MIKTSATLTRFALLTAVCLPLSAVGQDIDNGLAAYWKFDELSGTKAEDFSGNGYSIASKGAPVWGKGRVDGAVALSAGDFFTVPGQLGAPKDISFSVWVNIDALDASGSDIINVADSVFLSQSATGKGPFAGLQFHIRRSNGAYQTVYLNQNFTGTGWHHFVGAFESSSNYLILYVDGEKVAAESTNEPITYDTSKGVTVGGNSNVAGFDMIGSLDLVRVYERYITPEEVALLYEEGAGGLLAHYKLDEKSGTTATDSSGNGFDGTYSGAPVLGEAGVYEKSTQFNVSGKSDYLQLPEELIDGLTDVSVSFWIKTTRTGSQSILSSAGDSALNEFLVFFSSHTNLALYIKDKLVSWKLESIADDQWHHFTIVMDGSANKLTVYRDGKSLGTKSHGTSGNPLQVSTGGLMVAQEQDCIGGCFDTNQLFRGHLDELRIYSRTITAAEVADLYGLIGEWTFDEGTGSTAADTSLKANDAQFNTNVPAWVAGVRGTALEFNGTNDTLTDVEFDPPAKGSISMWWRSDGPPATRQRAWGLGGDFEMWQDPDGFISMDVSTDGFQGGFITTVPLYSPGRWYHIVTQWDSDDDSYAIYIDGELHKSGTSSWNIQKQAANRLSFGTRTGNTQRFTGALDDFRIYNRKITSDEISTLYGLVGHWKLDEQLGNYAPNGTTTPDSSGAGNHGAYYDACIPGDFSPYPSETGTQFDDPARIQVAHHKSLVMTEWGAFTLSCWVDPNTTNGQVFDIVGKHSQSGRSAYLMRYEADGRIGVHINEGNVSGGSGAWVGYSSTALNAADRACHLVVTYDGATVRWYINGKLDKSQNVSLTIGDEGDDVVIGDSFAMANYIEGVDDVRIYNRAVSRSEVAELYGLIGQWKLNEQFGSVASDDSGIDNDGVYQGGAAPGGSGPHSGEGAHAAEFGGNPGDKIALPAMSFDFSNGFTMETWYKANSISGQYTDFFSLSNGSLVDDMWFGLDNNNGLDLFLADTADGAAYRGLLENQAPTPGSWSHAAAVVDKYGNATLYRNGVVVASGYVGLPRNVPRSQNGIGETSFGHTLEGALYDVRLYNRPASPEEVAAAFENNSTPGIRIIRWVEVR